MYLIYLLRAEKHRVPQNDDVSGRIQHLAQFDALLFILATLNADPSELAVRNRALRNIPELRFQLLHLREPQNLPRVIHRQAPEGFPSDGRDRRRGPEIAETEAIAGNVDAPELVPELLSDRQGEELRETRTGLVQRSPVEKPPEEPFLAGIRRRRVLLVEVGFSGILRHQGGGGLG